MFSMFSDPIPLELFVQLGLAAVLGGLIGIERDFHGKEVGLRTNAMIALGACLFTILSFMIESDPTRIAAQVVTGVGFIGAGVLIKRGESVRGITTAVDIWLVAAVGMAVGMGQEWLAVFVTLLALVILAFLKPVSDVFQDLGEENHVKEKDDE